MESSEKVLKYSFEEYLEMEEQAEYKSEFYQGEIWAMSGGTRDHSLIGTNISRVLGNELMNGPCLVFGSDLLVRVGEADASFYPDCMVICGGEDYTSEKKNTVRNPKLIVEVLSDSTAAWDRGGKFRAYELLASLQEYVIVEQKEPQVDVYRRRPSGGWTLDRYAGLSGQVEFQSLNVAVPLAQLYYGINFGEA